MFGVFTYIQEPVLASKNAKHSHKHSSSSSHHHKKKDWQFYGPSEIKIANLENLMQFNPPQVTGRIASMAIGQTCNNGQCRLWVGSAGGGLWRTDNALSENPKWCYLGCHFGSAAIGSLVVDTNDNSDKTLYVGTGESNFNATSLAGSGLIKQQMVANILIAYLPSTMIEERF